MRNMGMMAAMAAMMLATAAAADVKAGTEAWAHADYKRAVAEWRGPALAGDPDAQFNMGQAYKLGRGVPVDMAQAEDWFHKAALQGHQLASDNYGLALFQDGKKAEAAPWLDRAATRGEARAQLVLGTMLFNGDGVPRDYPRAYALMTRAAQQGLKPAADTLAQMDQYISAPDRERGIALAEQYQAQARSMQVAAATPGATVSATPAPGRMVVAPPPAGRGPRPVDVPPSQVGYAPSPERAPIGRDTIDAPVRPAPRPTPRATAPMAHVAAPVTHAAVSRPTPVAAGRWRIQLGAFRDRGNAQGLWARVGSRIGGSPTYSTSGGITRLQAGPFASKADAEHACARAGSGCAVIPAG